MEVQKTRELLEKLGFINISPIKPNIFEYAFEDKYFVVEVPEQVENELQLKCILFDQMLATMEAWMEGETCNESSDEE